MPLVFILYLFLGFAARGRVMEFGEQSAALLISQLVRSKSDRSEQ